MKIHIIYDFKDGPWGGGNQFLKALKNEFACQGSYEEDISRADAILFNSHHFGRLEQYKKITKLKKNSALPLVFHRVDGPIELVRGSGAEIDQAVFLFNELFADGTIYQSFWIKEQSAKLGMTANRNYRVILNAPDPQIFYPAPVYPEKYGKTKLIATSWSGNLRKGFDFYQWLDHHLDFSLYSMTFIGNSPIEFKNIVHLQPLASEDLAEQLRMHHIYITASQHEPCSNALIEAMHCGLPAVAYNNGGNPDIVKEGGELFTGNAELIEKIDLVADSYEKYKARISLPDISTVAHSYLQFMAEVNNLYGTGAYTPKTANLKKIKYFTRHMAGLGFDLGSSEQGIVDKLMNKVVNRVKRIKQ